MVVLAEKSLADDLEATTCVLDEIMNQFKTKYTTITADQENICKQLAERSLMNQLEMDEFNKKVKSFQSTENC